MKFNGHFVKCKSLTKSRDDGEPEWIEKAKVMYHQDRNYEFPYITAWNILKYSPKWGALAQPLTPVAPNETKEAIPRHERPIGTKKDKKERKKAKLSPANQDQTAPGGSDEEIESILDSIHESDTVIAEALQKIANATEAHAAAASAQADHDLQKEKQEADFVLSLPPSDLTNLYKQNKMEELLLQQQLRNEKLRRELKESQSS